MPDSGSYKNVFRHPTFNHSNSDLETDLIEHLLFKEKRIHYLSLRNLTQPTFVRTYSRIDGIYDRTSEKLFPDEYEDGVTVAIVTLDGDGDDMKITLQSTIAEGAARSIPASVRDEIRI